MKRREKNLILIVFSVTLLLIGIVYFFLFRGTSVDTLNCAKEGEQFSEVYEQDFKEHCCAGLMEWASGFDTSISVADVCYETGALAGSPVGTCINCGNNICEAKENPCNCASDCVGKSRSDYLTVQEFCDKAFFSFCSHIEDVRSIGSTLCDLC